MVGMHTHMPCVSHSLTGHNTIGLWTIFMTEYIHLHLKTKQVNTNTLVTLQET